MGIVDLAEHLQWELKSLVNMLEILEIGIKQCTNGDNECETSSIYIVKKYLKYLQNDCDKLLELIDEKKK